MGRSRCVILIFLTAAVLAACSSGESPATAPGATGPTGTTTASGDQDGGASVAASIPDSQAIDELLADIPNHPEAIDLVTKCNILATVVLGRDLGANSDPEVAASLAELVDVARPLDPAVANALATDAAAAAAWCKATGMSNI